MKEVGGKLSASKCQRLCECADSWYCGEIENGAKIETFIRTIEP